MAHPDRHPLWRDRQLIVAEIAQAHDGSLGTAHAYIDAVAAAGAGAIKFQTHIADAESTPEEPWRVKFSPQDDTRYEYWQRMEFTEPQWLGLRKHAREAGIGFISSPFSNEAVQLLDRIEVDAYKIASGELSNVPMLHAIAATTRPTIVSSGMSPLSEIATALDLLGSRSSQLAVLQCTSEYPCPPERIGLNVLTELRSRFPGVAVGLSDHSGTIFPGLAAAALGGEVLEVHVTFSKKMFGPDVGASITIDELETLTRGVEFIETALANPVDKNAIAESMVPLRNLFTKSIVAATDLAAGHVLTMKDLALKKPGTGLPPDQIEQVTGRTLARDISRNEQLSKDQLR